MILQGLHVVEICDGIAGPLSGLRLHDLGANVIKIEPPGGDWIRATAPMRPGGESVLFTALSRGKRSLALGPNVVKGQSALDAVVAGADIVISDKTEAQLIELGIEHLRQSAFDGHSQQIWVSLSAYGATGSMRSDPGVELQAQAMAGYTRYLGAYSEPALRLGADVACAGTAIFATQSVLAALHARRSTGHGQLVSLSLLNTLLSLKSVHLAAQGDPDDYRGPRVGGANYPPERGWAAKDGRLNFAFGGSFGVARPGWEAFVREIGLGWMCDDDRFDSTGRSSTGTGSRSLELRPLYEEAFANHPVDQLVDKIRAHGGQAAAYQTYEKVRDHPQAEAIGLFRTVENDIRTAFPGRFSAFEINPVGVPPRLGQHTREVLAEIDIEPKDIDKLLTQGAFTADQQMDM